MYLNNFKIRNAELVMKRILAKSEEFTPRKIFLLS